MARSVALKFFFVKFNVILFYVDDRLTQERICLTYKRRTDLRHAQHRQGPASPQPII